MGSTTQLTDRRSESMQRRMAAMSEEQRRELSMIGVRARLAKRPPLSPQQLKENSRLARAALRREVIAHYGGKCKCCGELRLGFLTIDHVNGDGAAHRRSINHAPLYRWLRRNRFPDGFQVLCFNCNCSKGLYGRCAHEEAH